ncbi:MAG TPA: hypothetical protein VLV78_10100 [Thermoanaerobaculia bacterium]|nr:hypothetical protein [Thermoanaerobaculia bacterium]
MRNLLLAALLLATAPLHAFEMRVVMTTNIREVCHSVDTACTNFDLTTLYCACFLRAGAWKATAKITSKPIVYLSNRIYLVHELSHMFDFDRASRDYTRAIEAMSFGSRGACEAFVGNARQTFPDFMRDVMRESMRLRDHF